MYVYKYKTTTPPSNIRKCDCDIGDIEECRFPFPTTNDPIGTQCYDKFRLPRYSIYEVVEQTILKTYSYSIQFGTPNLQTNLNVNGSLKANQLCLLQNNVSKCITDWSQVLSSGGGAPIGDVIVIRGWNDCGGGQLDACSNYPGYIQIGAIHTGPGKCDSRIEGVDFRGRTQDAGWMIFCKKIQ